MGHAKNYVELIYLLFIVIGVIFSIVQALFKGKKIDLESLFKPETANQSNYDEDEEPIMVVDAQGNLIEPPKTPNRVNLPPVLPEAVLKSVKRHQQKQQKKSFQRQPVKPRRKSSTESAEPATAITSENTYAASNSYCDFIRNNAGTAIIMQEILGKPKALR